MSYQIGGIPIGGFIGWVKSYTNTPQNLPYGYVECNGQTLSDAASPFNGQVIPDLNGAAGGNIKRFIRGSTTSGGTGGSDSHSHAVTSTTTSLSYTAGGSNQTVVTFVNATNTTDTKPEYYEAVMIIRVK